MRAELKELEPIGSRIFGSEPELAIAIYNTSDMLYTQFSLEIRAWLRFVK